MKTARQYLDYKKPTWAPPSWLFGPVWSVLYVLIAVSYLYVGYLFLVHEVSFLVLLPFVLNLIFSFAYVPVQFGLKSFALATLDIFLVLGTLIWSLVVIYPVAAWVSYINIPYLLWVSFATVLQIAVTYMNRS